MKALFINGSPRKNWTTSAVLGGNLIPAGAHDFKVEINNLNEYYKNQMALLGIDVRLNTEMTAEELKNANADAIILALGSRPVMPKIPGIEMAVSGEDVLLGKKPVGGLSLKCVFR